MVERSNLPFWVTVVLIVLDFGIKAIALGLVPERRRPSSAMAWLLLIFFVPGFGLLLFFLLGSTFVNRRRRHIQAQAGMIVLQNNVYPSLPATATGPDWLRGSLTLNAKLGWLDPVAGNRIELYTDYDASIAAMAAAVDRAERFIHVEFSIVAWDDVTDPLFTALAAAARRGVAVELFVSEESDQFMVDHAQKSYYTALLEAGVRIFSYPLPTVLHAKHLTVDGAVAVIGSSNMDIRSFNLDFEVSVLFLGAEFVARMREVEDSYRAVSTEITLATWRMRPLPKRYLDNVMRLTSALQ